MKFYDLESMRDKPTPDEDLNKWSLRFYYINPQELGNGCFSCTTADVYI